MSIDDPTSQNPYEPPESDADPRRVPAQSQPARDASVGTIAERFKHLLSTRATSLLTVWGVIAGVHLVVVALSAVAQYQTGDAAMVSEMMQNPEAFDATQNQDLSPGAIFLSVLTYPLMAVYMVIYFGGYRIMRHMDQGTLERGEVELGALFHNFWAVLGVVLLYGIAATTGMMCCLIPGIVVAILFFPAPYMVSALDYSVTDALSTSVDWAKKHWVTILIVAGLGLLLGVLAGGASALGMFVFIESMGEPGIFLSSLLNWGVMSIAGYFIWVFSGATLLTIEECETARW